MTSELHPYEFISEFVSGGPKNYAYRVMIGATGEEKTVCKVRGITINYNASKLVNFERIKDMILKSGDEPQTVVNVHTEKKIKRKRKVGGLVSIVTEPEDKIYRISFFKGRWLDDHTSVPFGYK